MFYTIAYFAMSIFIFYAGLYLSDGHNIYPSIIGYVIGTIAPIIYCLLPFVAKPISGKLKERSIFFTNTMLMAYCLLFIITALDHSSVNTHSSLASKLLPIEAFAYQFMVIANYFAVKRNVE